MGVPDVNGFTGDGDFVRTVQLVGPDGMLASVLTLGARLLDVRVGELPVMCGFTNLAAVEADAAYVGVVVGRTANRVRGGGFGVEVEVGKMANLERNEVGVNHVHGGRRAWDKRLFGVVERGEAFVELAILSPDGDQGYPSSVEVRVRYELRGNGQLYVGMKTTNVGLVPTVTNMTVRFVFAPYCSFIVPSLSFAF